MKTNGNDPINMAQSPDAEYTGHLPLTKREYFAAMAMQGLRSGKLIQSAADGYHQRADKIWSSERIAKLAVEDADALIEALNKEAVQ